MIEFNHRGIQVVGEYDTTDNREYTYEIVGYAGIDENPAVSATAIVRIHQEWDQDSEGYPMPSDREVTADLYMDRCDLAPEMAETLKKEIIHQLITYHS